MAWIRLDDQIAHHPKFTRCSPNACWLWVTCLGHAQKYLTNGFLTARDIAASSHVRRPRECLAELVKVGLIDVVENGYQVHDYLHFNDSADIVKKKREEDRKRKNSGRNPSQNLPVIPEGVLARAPASHPIPSGSITKNNKLASSVSVSSENGVTRKKKAVAAPRTQPTNMKIITKIAHEVLRRNGTHDSVELRESVKELCAQRHIAYNSTIVDSALQSAKVQKRES